MQCHSAYHISKESCLIYVCKNAFPNTICVSLSMSIFFLSDQWVRWNHHTFAISMRRIWSFDEVVPSI